MLQVEAAHAGAPGPIQVGDRAAILGRVPPPPQRSWLTGLLRQTRDRDEQERPAHDGASAARITAGMLAMRLGMQPHPRPHARGAILRILDGEVIGGSRPRLGRVADELGCFSSYPRYFRPGVPT
jgi:hypothetical protein